MKTVNGRDYENWRIFIASIGSPNDFDLNEAKRRRLPLDEENAKKRYDHMKRLYDGGAPYSWIAKLYRLNRSQVYRIINKLPNN